MRTLASKVIIVTLIVTLLWPNIAFASRPVSYNATERWDGTPPTTRPSSLDAPLTPGVHVLTSTASSIVLELVTPDFTLEESLSEQGRCDLITVTGYGETDKSGWPRLPVEGAIVGIPSETQPALSVLETDVTTLSRTVRPCPVSQPHYDIAIDGTITYQGETALPDAIAYTAAGFYPENVAEIAGTGMVRDQHIAQLRFHPFQYDPTTGQIKHYRRIRVRLEFESDVNIDAGEQGHDKTATPAAPFDQILEQAVINYDVAQQWRETPVNRPATTLNNTPAPGQSGYKLGVNRDGLYRVSYAELEAAGLDLNASDPRTFTLSTQGTEVAIVVSGEDDGAFNPDDAIIFYGQKANTKFADVNVYWLTWGGIDGLRMAGQDGAPTGSGVVPESFRTTQHVEQNVYYQSSRPSGIDLDRWYWNYIWATSPATTSYTTTLSALAVGPAATGPLTATVRGLFKGYSAVPQHHTLVYLNGNLIDDATWASTAEYAFEVDVPQPFLIEGINTLTVSAPMDGGITSDNFLINRFEIDYHRTFAANGDSLAFDNETAGTWEYAINGFTTDSVQIFDVTAPAAPIRILSPVVDPDGSTYTARFEQTIDGGHQYVASTPAQFASVLSIAADHPSDLRATTNRADYVIITHGDFYTGVQTLADYRAAQGLRAIVVNVEDIYDEFNDGIFAPDAIRDFLAYAYANWTAPAPSYVVLVGDGHYDFKDYLGYGETNFIPPYLADVDPWIKEAAADNRYVCVSGADNFPDMHLGRLPVRSRAEVQAVITKIMDYEQNPAPGTWNQQTLFVTDNPDTAGNFYAYSDAVANYYVPSPYTVQKIYYGRTHTNVTQARADIITALNEGRLIVNYVGHGAIFNWATEQLLSRSSASTLTNSGKLPFVVPMACLDGMYIYPALPVATTPRLPRSSSAPRTRVPSPIGRPRAWG